MVRSGGVPLLGGDRFGFWIGRRTTRACGCRRAPLAYPRLTGARRRTRTHTACTASSCGPPCGWTRSPGTRDRR
eukprot:8497839-Pyramimonas_sp.AAC.2